MKISVPEAKAILEAFGVQRQQFQDTDTDMQVQARILRTYPALKTEFKYTVDLLKDWKKRKREGSKPK